ncbi:MAG: aldo/keto reductase [Chloroflexota bacterium]|nr:aldo/keto reductase [Chloroflexota bacterium]
MTDEPKISLGKTDIQITPLGIGAWAWGDKIFWGFGNGYGDADCKSAFDASIAAGINFFDSAELYGFGHSETLLGQFARKSKDSPIIATKFFPYPWRLRRANLVNALRASLKRMGLARVDLYQIHQPLPPVAIETWVDALGEAAQAGLTRAAGVSNYDANQTRRAFAGLAKRGVPLASNQVKYSLLDRHIERDGTMQTCRELGVTVIAYSPIEMGLLTGKYTAQHPPRGARGLRYSRQYLDQIQPVIARLREIGAAHGGKTPAQVALNWVMRKGAVPIPGAKNARQAEENIGALGWRLTESEIAAIDAAGEKTQE